MSSRPAPHLAGMFPYPAHGFCNILDDHTIEPGLLADNPPPYAFVTRVYRSNLRPVVLALASISALWTLAWSVRIFSNLSSIGFYKDLSVDKDENQPKLATLSIILGTLYIVTTVIEVFGVAAAGLQRYPLIRIYAFLTILAAFIVIAAGFIRVVTHFILKNDLIGECTQDATGQRVDFRWGIWGPRLTKTLTEAEAKDWCNDAWNHDSWSEIIALIAAIVLMSMFSFVAWSYVHQALSVPKRTQTVPVPTYQNPYYNPPFASTEGALPHLGYGAGVYPGAGSGEVYAPPAGPPPAFASPKDNGDHELPGYGVGVAGDLKGDVKDRDRDVDGKGEDPFADYNGQQHRV
ncbi:hypothetical protein OF83DRAFT_1169958 [Amylostereum chailletii]|nr:hypothetical protein OF83DRAFT_1169958 [Amylostereum chailletii]